MQISDHLYLYLWDDKQETNCNSIFIDGKVPLLIDPGWSHHIAYLFARMRKDGLDPSKTRVVLCTHCHPDHFGGTVAFKNRSVKIAISRPEEMFIEQVSPDVYNNQGLSKPEYQVDFYVSDGDLILGRHEFHIFLTPGHSPGSICIYWPRFKVLVTGDLVLMNSVGRTDLPGGDGKRLLESIEKIAGLPVELIIPGHGPAIQGQNNVQRNFDFIKRSFYGLR